MDTKPGPSSRRVANSSTDPTSRSVAPTRLRGGTPGKKQQEAPPKPKLTVKEQLNIMEKIKNKDFIPALGLAQFYPENQPKPGSSSQATYADSKKNLLSQFDQLSVSTAQTVVGSGAGPMFASTALEEPLLSEDEKPDYIKKMEQFNTLFASYRNSMDKFAEIKAGVILHELLNEKRMCTLMAKLDKVTNTISNFLQKPIKDQKEFFEPLRSNNGEAKISVDLNDQQRFFEAFRKMKALNEKVDQMDLPVDMKEKIKKLWELTHGLSKSVDDLSEAQAQAQVVHDKIAAIEDADSSGCFSDSDKDQASPNTKV